MMHRGPSASTTFGSTAGDCGQGREAEAAVLRRHSEGLRATPVAVPGCPTSATTVVTVERHLEWHDCSNVRDLGGLPTLDGHMTRRRAVSRADSLDRLTRDGWGALEEYGVRTIIDLRNDVEREAEPYTCGLSVVHVPIEDDTDGEFIELWRPFSTPHYYGAALERWPERTVAAVREVARAGPGGVVVHCGRGRDRTGLVAVLLLALAGVHPDDILWAVRERMVQTALRT